MGVGKCRSFEHRFLRTLRTGKSQLGRTKVAHLHVGTPATHLTSHARTPPPPPPPSPPPSPSPPPPSPGARRRRLRPCSDLWQAGTTDTRAGGAAALPGVYQQPRVPSPHRGAPYGSTGQGGAGHPRHRTDPEHGALETPRSDNMYKHMHQQTDDVYCTNTCSTKTCVGTAEKRFHQDQGASHRAAHVSLGLFGVLYIYTI